MKHSSNLSLTLFIYFSTEAIINMLLSKEMPFKSKEVKEAVSKCLAQSNRTPKETETTAASPQETAAQKSAGSGSSSLAPKNQAFAGSTSEESEDDE